MEIMSRRFEDPKSHHRGWFRIFRFDGGVEIWTGSRFTAIFF